MRPVTKGTQNLKCIHLKKESEVKIRHLFGPNRQVMHPLGNQGWWGIVWGVGQGHEFYVVWRYDLRRVKSMYCVYIYISTETHKEVQERFFCVFVPFNVFFTSSFYGHSFLPFPRSSPTFSLGLFLCLFLPTYPRRICNHYNISFKSFQ